MTTIVLFELIETDTNLNLQYIKILDKIIDIKQKKIYEISLNNVINIFIIEDVIFKFKHNEITHQITIYKNINNHFLIEGDKIHNNSLQFIFQKEKELTNELCFIEYKNKKYFPKNNFPKVKNRKLISFVNIDMNNIKFENEDILYKNGNFLFNIILNDDKQREIIAQYEFIKKYNEKENEYNKKEAINKIKTLFNNIKQNFFDDNDLKDRILFLKKTEFFFEKDKMVNFNKNIRKRGYEIYKEIYKNYLNKYISNLDEDDIILYNLISELLLICINQSNLRLPIFFRQYFNAKMKFNNFINTIPNYINDSIKAKLKLTVSKTIFNYINITNDLDYEFNYIDIEKEDSIYYDARKKCIDFINCLNEDSELFFLFLSLNSGISKNYLLKSNYESVKISMISYEVIKNLLFSCILSYSIRGKLKNFPKSITDLNTRITIFNEEQMFSSVKENEEIEYFTNKQYSLIEKKDNNNSIENIKSENDPFYLRRFILTNIMKKEIFIKKKMRLFDSELNKYNSTPILFYDKRIKKFLFLKINDIYQCEYKKEEGYSFEYFISRGNNKIIFFIKSPYGNCKDLFDKSSFKSKNEIDEFYKIIIERIEEEYNKGNIKINENEDDDDLKKIKDSFSLNEQRIKLLDPKSTKFYIK